MFSNYNITAVRILPNDRKTFTSESEFRDFILNTVSKRNGRYNCFGTIMNAEEGTLVLFQYNSMIRAAAVLKEVSKTGFTDASGEKYNGYYIFYPDTLYYLDYPITEQEMKAVDPEFKKFSQSKQNVPLSCLDSVSELCFRKAEKTIHEAIESGLDGSSLTGETRKTVVKARINQSVFRSRLLRKYGKCCICGIQNPEFLVASHIKPWSDSSPEERLDLYNGLLLCPHHDRLFDRGYIGFEDDGKIIISDTLSDCDRILMNADPAQSIKTEKAHAKYLKYHRENIIKRA